MNSKRLVFTGKQQVELESFEPGVPTDDQVRVSTRYSLMSTGTENIVFNRLFDPGTPWEKWVQYPFYPGYSAIGEVVEVGRAVTGVEKGMFVAVRGSHTSDHIVDASQVFRVPDGIDLQSAAWFALAKIGFMGARVSDYGFGSLVMIVGAGPIGQMSVRWAAAAGVGKIVVVDPIEGRLALAKRGGATAVISKPVADCKDDVLDALGGAQPTIVNDATGNAAVFAATLGLAALYGRVVILGDTGSPTNQRLTPDVINRGLTIVGAHDVHNDETWNNATITNLFFDLVRRGKFDLTGLNTHSFRPDQAITAYELANTKRGETMGIIFDWTKAG